jgi:hypothetical protein
MAFGAVQLAPESDGDGQLLILAQLGEVMTVIRQEPEHGVGEARVLLGCSLLIGFNLLAAQLPTELFPLAQRLGWRLGRVWARVPQRRGCGDLVDDAVAAHIDAFGRGHELAGMRIFGIPDMARDRGQLYTCGRIPKANEVVAAGDYPPI